MSHLDPGLLHELLDGEVPSTELPAIQAHLAVCEECRARLEYERQLLTDVDGLVAAIELPAADEQRVARTFRNPSRSRWRPGLAWAATVFLAAGLGYLAGGAGLLPEASHDKVIAPANSGTTASKPVPQVHDSGLAVASRQTAPAEHESAPTPPEAIGLQQRKANSAAGGIAAGGSRSEPRDELAAKSVVGVPAPDQPAAVAGAPPAPKPAEDRAEPAAKSAGRVSAQNRLVTGAVATPPPDRMTRAQAETRRADAPAPNAIAARQSSDSVVVAAEPITLSDAIRRLGGTLRLIDGMVPLRLELREPYVRVVYPTAQGELVLQQQLIDGRVVFQLVPPRGFPTDSLARLRARVKE
jgi:anti-sigma factor RsiW